jgi:hypothetical protein
VNFGCTSLGLDARQRRWAIFSSSISIHGGGAAQGRTDAVVASGSAGGPSLCWLLPCRIFLELTLEWEMLRSRCNMDLIED